LARVLKSDGMTFTLSSTTRPTLALSLPVLSLLAVSLSNGRLSTVFWAGAPG
jgi:hypothetical protein